MTQVRVEERTVQVRAQDSGTTVRVAPTRNAISLLGKALPTTWPVAGKRVLLYDATGAALSWSKVSAAEVDPGAATAGQVLTAPGGGVAPSWQDPGVAAAHAPSHDFGGSDVIAGAGRLARAHYLDADPRATGADTREFLTAMSQAQLEADGWTFEAGVTGAVENGMLVLKATTGLSDYKGCYRTVSLAGDFDFIAAVAPPIITDADRYPTQNLGLVFAVVSGVTAFGIKNAYLGDALRTYWSTALTYPGLAGGWTAVSMGSAILLRISRKSGTVYLGQAVMGYETYTRTPAIGFPQTNYGWYAIASIVSAATIDKIYLGMNPLWATKTQIGCWFLRRYV